MKWASFYSLRTRLENFSQKIYEGSKASHFIFLNLWRLFPSLQCKNRILDNDLPFCIRVRDLRKILLCQSQDIVDYIPKDLLKLCKVKLSYTINPQTFGSPEVYRDCQLSSKFSKEKLEQRLRQELQSLLNFQPQSCFTQSFKWRKNVFWSEQRKRAKKYSHYNFLEK